MTPSIVEAMGLAIAFGLLTATVIARRSAASRVDDRLMAAIARLRTERLDWMIGPLSMIATQEPLTLQGLIAFLMFLVTVGGKAALHFALMAIGSGILSDLAKRVVRRPRPKGPYLIVWVRGSSYPSGDLVTATAIYLTIALMVSPFLPDGAARPVLFAIVGGLVVMLAGCRVYAGVHHPSDVLGGALLGAAWALFVSVWFA